MYFLLKESSDFLCYWGSYKMYFLLIESSDFLCYWGSDTNSQHLLFNRVPNGEVKKVFRELVICSEPAALALVLPQLVPAQTQLRLLNLAFFKNSKCTEKTWRNGENKNVKPELMKKQVILHEL